MTVVDMKRHLIAGKAGSVTELLIAPVLEEAIARRPILRASPPDPSPRRPVERAACR